MKKAHMATLIAISLACTPLCCSTAALAAEDSSNVQDATEQALTDGGSLFSGLSNALSGIINGEKTQIKQSPDKYTWYVRDYVGLNAATIGYTSLGNERREEYGAGTVKITYIASDGSYVDPTDEDTLKQYIVYAQNIEPNTEIKYTFMTDSEGNEYSNLTQWQSVDEIVLDVCRTNEDPSAEIAMTPITPSPDRYTAYVHDYVGRNLAACGYTSLGGDYRDAYGAASIELVLTADDGSFVDPEDEESLSQWVVTAQDVPANTQLTMTYLTDMEGNEYDNLTDTVSLNAITLQLTHAPTITAAGQASGDDIAVTNTTSVTPEFKETMDDYETFMNQYCDFMVRYQNATTAELPSMLVDYASLVQQETEWIEKIDAIDESSLSAADDAYYLEVNARVLARLAQLEGQLGI